MVEPNKGQLVIMVIHHVILVKLYQLIPNLFPNYLSRETDENYYVDWPLMLVESNHHEHSLSV